VQDFKALNSLEVMAVVVVVVVFSATGDKKYHNYFILIDYPSVIFKNLSRLFSVLLVCERAGLKRATTLIMYRGSNVVSL